MKNNCLFVCTVYTGNNLQKKQQRFFCEVADAVEFGGKCVKRYPRFEYFIIDAVDLDTSHTERVASFSIKGECVIKYPANFTMFTRSIVF